MYSIRSILTGAVRISHTKMQFKMLIPPVPSRAQFRTVLGHSGNSGQFRLKYKFRPVLESELRERENEKNSLENETMGYLPLL